MNKRAQQLAAQAGFNPYNYEGANGVKVEPGYQVSVNGRRRQYPIRLLLDLKMTDEIQEISKI